MHVAPHISRTAGRMTGLQKPSLLLLGVFGVCLGCLHSSSGKTINSKVWKFAGSGNKRPYNYIDADGFLRGFDVDLVTAVCQLAGRDCIVEVHPFTDCGTTNDNGEYVPGKGLSEGKFDACVSRAVTEDRLKFFEFSIPYAKSYARFFTLPNNPRRFDEENVSGKTIVLVTGFYTNDECLKKYNKTGASYKIGKRITEAVDLVLNQGADALFAPRTRISGLEPLSWEYDCTLGGTGMMALKGSSLPSWWDGAFNRLKETGVFRKLCEASEKRHGKAVRCAL